MSRVFVAGDHGVSVIDTATNTVVATVGAPLRSHPLGIDFDPNLRRVLAAGLELWAIDASTNQPTGPDVPTGIVTNIAVDPARGRAFAVAPSICIPLFESTCDADPQGQIGFINPESLSVTKVIPGAGANLTRVAVDFSTGTIYTVDDDPGAIDTAVWAWDGGSGALLGHVTVPRAVGGIAIGGRRGYVPRADHALATKLAVIDLDTMKEVGEFPIDDTRGPLAQVAFDPFSGKVFAFVAKVGRDVQLVAFEPVTGVVEGEVPVSGYFPDIAIDTREARAYISEERAVLVVDTLSLQPIVTIPVPEGTGALVFVPAAALSD